MFGVNPNSADSLLSLKNGGIGVSFDICVKLWPSYWEKTETTYVIDIQS